MHLRLRYTLPIALCLLVCLILSAQHWHRLHPLSNPAAPPPAPITFGWPARLTLVAGDGIAGQQDGPRQQARFADPYGIAVDGIGNVYLADAGDNNRIRKLGADGHVTTLAGSVEGFQDGNGTSARFNTPSGIALDAAGNLSVADTGNHAIRTVTPQGIVTTLAGTGAAGFRDGPARQAQFNGPIGVASGPHGEVYVADTYNDRIRVITPDGQVRTLAGGDHPGYQDGPAASARFNTPCGLAMDAAGNVWVADTGNDALRKISPTGDVSTVWRADPSDRHSPLRRPVSVALSSSGFVYVGTMAGGRVLQVAPNGQFVPIVDTGQPDAPFALPAGIAISARDALYIADSAAHRVHQLLPRTAMPSTTAPVPVPTGPSMQSPLPNTAGRWPVRPQNAWHEVVGTLGEVRGNRQGESRDHLHGGLDIRGDVGAPVVAIADAKVSDPLSTWGYNTLNEGFALDSLTYIHMRVGRTPQDKLLDPVRFQFAQDDDGSDARIRVRRGTRFHVGDVLGTINAMAHVHLNLGVGGYQRNAIALGFQGFTDHQPPHIDAIALFDLHDQPLIQKQGNRLLVPRELAQVKIVVDAWDQVDDNRADRRLGLYALGYQILHADGTPLPGFEQPQMNIVFDRMPSDDDAVKVVYAPSSGITVFGSASTRFRYVVTNTVRSGQLATGSWPVSTLPPGDYLVRITARDYAGNVASKGRDLPVRLQ